MLKNPVQIWIFDIVFTVAVIAICLITKPDKQQMANNYNDIWTNGVETTGTMTKMKQRLTDPDRTIFQVRVRLEYEVNGMHYEAECIVPKKEFNKLDPDGDGVATVQLRYDPDHPSRATMECAATAAQKTLKLIIIWIWVLAALTVLEVLLLPTVIRIYAIS